MSSILSRPSVLALTVPLLVCDYLLRTLFFFFFFNDTATTEIYTLSLHDALPISIGPGCGNWATEATAGPGWLSDRKSTRLNSSHLGISYAVFCLKKKKKKKNRRKE